MKICALIVTYNRLNKLKIALNKYEELEKGPDLMLVINNASTDGTFEYLENWKNEPQLGKLNTQRIVIHSETNTGGSGGFHMGLEKALELDCEWIWVADDDAFPENDAFIFLRNFIDELGDKAKEYSAICGQVLNHGVTDISHRCNLKGGKLKVVGTQVPATAYQNKCFEINIFTYVGTVINKELLSEVGTTNEQYFIWYDDAEHSLRLSKVGKIVCSPAVRINHDQLLSQNELALNWKEYYGMRNMLDMIKSHFSYRYYFVSCGLLLTKIFLSACNKNTWEYAKMACAALMDEVKGRKGMHSVYKPGWKPKSMDSVVFRFHKLTQKN